MAFAETDKDEDELAGSGAPVAIGPAAGGATLGGDATGGAAGAAAAAAPSAAGGSSTPFVGIKQYLDANKAQSGKLAGDVGGYVNDLSQQARDTVPKQTDLFNQQVDQNTVNLDKNVFDKAIESSAAVANDPNQKAAFQKMRDATYKGPTNFETSELYKPAEEAFKKAQAAGTNTASETGQKQLVNQFQQKSTGRIGSAGTTSFDQMLLQGDAGKQALTQAREGQKDLTGLLDSAKAQANDRAAKAAQTTAATKAAIAKEFGEGGANSQKPIVDALLARAKNQINQSNTQKEALKTALTNGTPLNAQDLKTLNISQADYQGLLNTMAQIRTARAAVGNTGQGNNNGFETAGGFTGAGATPGQDFDLSKYVTEINPETQINAQNVANEGDFARYQALNELMGTENTFLNANQVGKANTDSIDLNLQGAKDYLAGILGGIKVPDRAKAEARVASQSGQMGGVLGGIVGGMSDKNVKKDIQPFRASEFLDSLSSHKEY